MSLSDDENDQQPLRRSSRIRRQRFARSHSAERHQSPPPDSPPPVRRTKKKRKARRRKIEEEEESSDDSERPQRESWTKQAITIADGFCMFCLMVVFTMASINILQKRFFN